MTVRYIIESINPDSNDPDREEWIWKEMHEGRKNPYRMMNLDSAAWSASEAAQDLARQLEEDGL